MNSLNKLYTDYGWGVLVILLLAIGGRIYFTFQPLGLTFVLTGLMLILALENSDMIHAVDEESIEHKKLKTMLVHLHGQRSIARFIYLYHFYTYGFLVVFTLLSLLLGIDMSDTLNTIINILILFFFGTAGLTIFIRRILVGAKYEH